MWRVDFFCGGWNFSKSVSVDPTFIREMRVIGMYNLLINVDAMPQPIDNSHHGNWTPVMFNSYYYLKLRGKHCRKPNCYNGVVDNLGLRILCNL